MVLLSMNLNAQVNFDSLWSVWIDETKEDTIRLKALDDFVFNGFKKNKMIVHYTMRKFSLHLPRKKD